jgi:hypothetical protein
MINRQQRRRKAAQREMRRIVKLSLDEVLKDAKGLPFNDKAKLGDAIYSALNAAMPTDQQLSLPEQMKRYRLLQRIGVGGEIDVTAEDIAMIKDRVSKVFPISVVGAVVDAVEALSAPRLVEPAAAPAGENMVG